MSINKINMLNVHELHEKMQNNVNLCLIDVREQEEWDEMHIPQALLIPKDQITARIQATVTDKTLPIYLLCKGGVRSLYAAQHLIDLGYQEVYSVDGGLIAWLKAGYAVKQPIRME